MQATISTGRGTDSTYQELCRIEVDRRQQTVTLELEAYADRAAYEDGARPLTTLHVQRPLADVPGAVRGPIDRAAEGLEESIENGHIDPQPPPSSPSTA